VAQRAFDELVENVKLENCVFFPDVVNAIFRRVPGKVEAENYGHDDAGTSYFVKEAGRKSEYYRTSEPVPVERTASEQRRFRSGQCIRLQASEWTAYAIHSLAARSCNIVVRAKAEDTSSAFQFTIGQREKAATLTDNDWTELDLGALQLSEGANRLEVRVKSGEILFDWFRLDEN
jgi:hypothetical protein